MLSFVTTALVALLVVNVTGNPDLFMPTHLGLFGFHMTTAVVGYAYPQLQMKSGLFNLALGTPIQFNGDEAKKGMLIPAFINPAFEKWHTVVEDIKAKTQLAFVGRIDKVTITDPGCGTGALTKTIPLTEKFWDPKPVKMWIKQCHTTLNGTFLVWGKAKGYDIDDLTKASTGEDPEGYWNQFVMEIMTTAAMDDLWRMAYLSDTAAAVHTSGGQLLSAGEVPNYNQIDGLWKQWFAAVAATNMARVTITENGNASFATQLALAATRAKDVLMEMVTQADSRLLGDEGLHFKISRSLWNNWRQYRLNNNVLESSWKNQTTGQIEGEWEGIPFVVVENWDRWIKADIQNGTTYYRPHRAVLTTKSNVQVGFDVRGDQSFKAWHNIDTEETNMRGRYMLDAQYLHDFMTVVAY